MDNQNPWTVATLTALGLASAATLAWLRPDFSAAEIGMLLAGIALTASRATREG